MSTIDQPLEAEILSRVIPEGALNSEAAQVLLQLEFREQDIERMNQLALKNRSGTISPEELDEMERYSRVGNLLNLVRCKARRSLQNDQ